MARTRQLAAIMCTDIDGYASLIQQDESMALELKDRHRKVLHRTASKFHGKIQQNIGHESLTLFNSAVEAVQCSIEMQLAFQEHTPVPVKIAVHLGDIIFTGEEAIGDGIMVARKIQTQAPPGGILVSNKIYEEIKNQSGIQTRYVKACELDEQGQRVEVYAISNEGIAVSEGARPGKLPVTLDKSSGSGVRFFWEEAKRRKVIRVIVVYAGAVFVIIDLISNIEDPLGLPKWLPTIIILLLIIGFPVTAILSWIFDLTPEGIKRTKPAEEFKAVELGARADSDASWFVRKKILRRYLIPMFVAGVLVCFYIFKDKIFENWERVNRVAREHTERANLYLTNQADPELIKQELDLALEADPDYDSALYAYALVHRREGDTLLAKQKLHRTLDSNPAYSKAWGLLASFAFWQDSFELSMHYALNALDADPTNTHAAYNMAIQMEDRGFDTQAEALYKKAIEIDSLFTSAYSALGSLYNKMNRPIDAITTLKKTLKISPSSQHNYRIYKNLAEANFLMEDYEEAWVCLLESKTLNPDFEDTEKCFARYYEATGDPEASILHWRRYLSLESDSLEIQKAEEHLDSLRLLFSK